VALCNRADHIIIIILLLMKVSDSHRDRNVKGKNVACVKLISNLPTEEFVSCDLGHYNSAVLIKTSTN